MTLTPMQTLLNQDRGSADTERMASMIIAIDQDMTLPQAKKEGIVEGEEEEVVWLQLAEDILEIKSAGAQVEIPSDIL